MISTVKVLVFIILGCSAGAIVCLLMIPILLGLFAAAIIQLYREKKGWKKNWEEPFNEQREEFLSRNPQLRIKQ